MQKNSMTQTKTLDPKQTAATTESGELEHRQLRRRKIDCGGNPEIQDRRNARGGGRREVDQPAAQ